MFFDTKALIGLRPSC